MIAAMAETPNVMPQLHMPLQSGSDAILRSMRRSYRSERYLGIIDNVRAAMPEAAITTDIIVGFPGETEEDFQATLRVVCAARFAAAFTFQYSIRPGTPAATMNVRFPRQSSRIATTAWSTGRRNCLAGEPEAGWPAGRGDVRRWRGPQGPANPSDVGRARDNRLVHVSVPEEPQARPRPGDMADVVITYAAPHHLNADAGLVALRRTAGGDVASQPVGTGSLCNRSWDPHGRRPWYVTAHSNLHCTPTKLPRSRCMPAERFVEQLNIQIGHEFAAHQQYVACAVYYDALTMPQMAGFFYDQAWKSATTR